MWLLTYPTTKLVREVAGLTVSQLILDHPIDLVDQCVLRPLFLPLLRFSLPPPSPATVSDGIAFISTENELDACISALKCTTHHFKTYGGYMKLEHEYRHVGMLLGPVPPAPVLEALVPVFRPLVYLDAFARARSLSFTSSQESVLFVQQLPSAASRLASCVLPSSAPLRPSLCPDDCATPRHSTSQVVYCAGGSGGVGLRQDQPHDDNVIIDNVIDAIVDLLGQPQLDDQNNVVVGELFSHLLTTYMHVKTSSHFEPSNDRSKSSDTGSMRLLLRLTEDLGPAVLRSGVLVLQCLVTVLSMYTNQDADATGDNEADDDDDDMDVLSVGLSMATTIVQAGAAARSADEEALLTQMLVPLEQLARHPKAPIAEMASDLCLHILARSADDHKQDVMTAAQSFAEMLDRSKADLQSAQVPLRARGLARLTRWIRRRQPVDNVEALVALCVHHLADADSYVYLAAVQALAGLGDVYADKTIPLLLDALAQDATYSVEQRIKLSEALLFTARRCGDVMPKYGRAFVFGYLRCIRSRKLPNDANEIEEATLRASCLSNLAEVCGLLHWAISPYITDVVGCVRGILETERLATDAHIALRRGAVFVLYNMLQLMGRDILEAVPDAMTPIYRLLKMEASTEKDAVCRFHAENSVKALDTIMRGELFNVGQASSSRPGGLPSLIFLNQDER
ncbi:hypothetical protein DYB25_008072 [Aphanomyces astaci]|uniref:Uncharacterized protein n=2 Tax=Aphanomyces astaci TaxID=112090 RepID=A0A397BU04_APHAT|nr:hypothetical protein DYB25_008072 [Aphanomyces astaci]RHY38268.1 hypothetical protein DYB38_011417 [Aphanomyces astaci]RHY50743.1 hypothetical protein DYB30_002164 [Aphanomyces astaci]RHY68701.1 hypothetical protein DYB34_008033 [Aphanomyces astaci]RHY81286.1 hypothetical protein DYB31_012072 [Aphanomyces astaci]